MVKIILTIDRNICTKKVACGHAQYKTCRDKSIFMHNDATRRAQDSFHVGMRSIRLAIKCPTREEFFSRFSFFACLLANFEKALAYSLG